MTSRIFNLFGLLRDTSSRPSPSKCMNGMRTLIAIVCVVCWSPFNVMGEHRSTWIHKSCKLPSQCLAPQVGNEARNKTEVDLRRNLRLRSRGSMGRKDGGNRLQGRCGNIPCKDGFMHWLHVIRGAALFNSTSMGCFNNDIAL